MQSANLSRRLNHSDFSSEIQLIHLSVCMTQTITALLQNNTNMRTPSIHLPLLLSYSNSPIQMVILTPISATPCARTPWVCCRIVMLFERFAISPFSACWYWIHGAVVCWMATEQRRNCPWQSETELVLVLESGVVPASVNQVAGPIEQAQISQWRSQNKVTRP